MEVPSRCQGGLKGWPSPKWEARRRRQSEQRGGPRGPTWVASGLSWCWWSAGPKEGPSGVVGEESAGHRAVAQGRGCGPDSTGNAGHTHLCQAGSLPVPVTGDRGPLATGVDTAETAAGWAGSPEEGSGGFVEACVAEVQGAKGHGVQAAKGQSLLQTKALRKCQGWAVPGGPGPHRGARRVRGAASAEPCKQPFLLGWPSLCGQQGWPGGKGPRAGVQGGKRAGQGGKRRRGGWSQAAARGSGVSCV